MKIDKNIITQILQGVKWTSAVAAAIVGVLLLATIIQTHVNQPIIDNNFDAVFQLIDRNPTDQNLREEIRALDMLARRAYFTSQHQIRTGTIIFFIALAAFLISWNAQVIIFPAVPPLPNEKKLSWWKQQTQSAKIAAIVSVIVLFISLTFAIVNNFSIISQLISRQNKITDHAQYAEWWMNFRGPSGIGVAHHTNAPKFFDGESMTNIKWKVEVPLEGFNSPVVFQNRIFLTGANAEKRQVYSFDVNTGNLLWSRDVRTREIENAQMPRVDRETGFAAPSVATDGQNVYAIFATGEIAAFTINGRPLWSKFLGVPENHYGHSSSLITFDGKVFVQFDEYDTGKLFAFDGRTGRTVWEVERKILSWASPILINNDGRFELVLVDNENVTSYNPNTGEIFWSIECMGGEVGPSAAFANSKVFVANEYAVAAAIQITNDNAEILWETRRNLPNTSSPVSVDSILFLATAGGTVSALDNRDGSVYWTHEFDRGFYSSPIVVGENIFLFDRNGVMHVFAAAAEFNLIGSSALGEPVTTTPAILDGFMIVRGDKYLYRIE